MSSRQLASAACAALILAACSIGKPLPQATTFVIEPPPPAAAPAAARRPDTMRVGNVRVAAPFAGNGLVYRVGEVRFTSDPYNAFIAEPAAMLGYRMAEWLDRAGPFRAVAPPESARPARFVLEATVSELYGDFRAGSVPAAVLAVQFALIDQGGVRPRVVHEGAISKRIDLPEATPDALVGGYGKALAAILADLVAQIKAVPSN